MKRIAGYLAIPSGDWIQPMHRRGFKMQCCDCGLVHSVDFRLVIRQGRKVLQLRTSRDNRATGQIRRHRYHDKV